MAIAFGGWTGRAHRVADVVERNGSTRVGIVVVAVGPADR
jgi:hypothetical protein